MNYGSIRYIIGWILRVEGILMIMPMLVALIYRECSGIAFVISALICILVGTLLSSKKPKKTTYYAREGYISVALGWIIMSMTGCMPFVLSGEIPSFIDAFFEIVQDLRQREQAFYQTLKPYPKACCSGEAFLTGLAAWAFSFLFWQFCL